MAVSEIGLLSRIRFRRLPDTNIPISDRPELKPGKKGYLIITAPHNPDNPLLFVGEMPEGLSARALGVDPKRPSETEFVIWNPLAVDLVADSYSLARNPRAKEDAKMRTEILRRAGYNETIQRKYPDRIVLIAVRKPAILASPEAHTSR